MGEKPGYRKTQDGTGLTVLEIPVFGEESDVLANLPEIGDPHPDDDNLICAEAPEQGEPGGGVSSTIVYKGGDPDGNGVILGPGYTEPRRSGNDTEKTLQVTGLVYWKHPSPTVAKTGNFEAQFSIRYRANSVSYRYAGTSWFTSPKFADLAETDVSDDPQILSKKTSEPVELLLQKNAAIIWRKVRFIADTTQTFTYYLYPDGTALTGTGADATTAGVAGGDLTGGDYQIVSEKTYFGVLNGYEVEDNYDFRRIYSIQKETVAPSLYTYSETWELEGDVSLPAPPE